MKEPLAEFLVLSRGKWDDHAPEKEIEDTIAKFYDWLDRNVAEGRMKMGSRLKRERMVVGRKGITVDGPFNETKEVIGGYWLIVARSLQEAAELAAENPCVQIGLTFEIRPLDSVCANVRTLANETPDSLAAIIRRDA
ncbi:MAG: YciI family protein [Luteolibacter sp.]|uniref:YciI family protein n=1 Tax=Luteolibacter sp. TaxID=1962973 RepID=UPI0032655E86